MSAACDLDWITEDLAVGGCCGSDLAMLAKTHRLGAVIDLRAEDVDDAHAWSSCGVSFLSLPTEDHAPIGRPMLDAGLDFAAAATTRGLRLLVHCQHGIGRSVTLALCVLVTRGEAPLDALARVKARRPKASPSVVQMQAWLAWLRERGSVSPPFEACAAVVYGGPAR